ncbi:methyltransferase [Actinomadura sp. BRA 177]|uniref:methyltransferase n=1 Tax=Actinomadura sp. BRA 177 TaxID=2745202 RepID=UPI0015952C41|nr:methyltransferase [Actinomadura sp. BRA 177]NVI86894.1 methyltransferase [Actinomadura sp. BRA 177]
MSEAMTPSQKIVDVVTGTWRAQALYAAAALRLADHVAAGHRTAKALAVEVGADGDGIARLMRLLVGLGVFAGDDHAGYDLTPLAQLLRSDARGSMRDMCVLYGEEFHRAWGAVATTVKTGRSGFEASFQQDLHSYLAESPGAGAKFLRAMNAGSVFFEDVPRVYDFTGCRTVTDLAGGSGLLLSTVLRAAPAARGVLFDRPHMLAVAEEHLAAAVPGRYELVAGDFFGSVPGGSDVYLLSRVLQDWEDRGCVRVLTNVRKAMMKTAARLLVVERVIPTGAGEGRLLPQLFDLHLLMMAGGRERTLDGYRSLLEAAGLRLTATHDLALETSLLVAEPV